MEEGGGGRGGTGVCVGGRSAGAWGAWRVWGCHNGGCWANAAAASTYVQSVCAVLLPAASCLWALPGARTAPTRVSASCTSSPPPAHWARTNPSNARRHAHTHTGPGAPHVTRSAGRHNPAVSLSHAQAHAHTHARTGFRSVFKHTRTRTHTHTRTRVLRGHAARGHAVHLTGRTCGLGVGVTLNQSRKETVALEAEVAEGPGGKPGSGGRAR